MKKILAIGAAVVGLVGLVGGCGNKNPKRTYEGYMNVNASACENQPYVVMNSRGNLNYFIECADITFLHMSGCELNADNPRQGVDFYSFYDYDCNGIPEFCNVTTDNPSPSLALEYYQPPTPAQIQDYNRILKSIGQSEIEEKLQ